jgi:hypothetical protein
VIVDPPALAAGAGAVAWPRLPPGLSARAIEDEHLSLRMRWALAAAVVFAAPLAWPRAAAKPAWVEIPTAQVDDPEPEIAAVAVPEIPKLEVPTGEWKVPEAKFDPFHERSATSSSIEPASTSARSTTTASAVLPDSIASATSSSPAPTTVSTAAPPPPVAPPVVKAPVVRSIPVVMYLNPFCAHCRATHARLDSILGGGYAAPVRMRHVYVWASNDIPYWAWACALGGAMGIEDRVFGELLRARNDRPDQVQDAAVRAGLDPTLLASAVGRADLRTRLEHDRGIVAAARIEGLPTLDVGRRRLMGEQSEEELLDALEAARPR